MYNFLLFFYFALFTIKYAKGESYNLWKRKKIYVGFEEQTNFSNFHLHLFNKRIPNYYIFFDSFSSSNPDNLQNKFCCTFDRRCRKVHL